MDEISRATGSRRVVWFDSHGDDGAAWKATGVSAHLTVDVLLYAGDPRVALTRGQPSSRDNACAFLTPLQKSLVLAVLPW